VHAIYTTFSFEKSEIPILHKYDEGEAKEGVGAGAALAFATKQNIENQKLLDQIELLIYSM
jgi:NaMN:DMB phosphoribosyltransferase